MSIVPIKPQRTDVLCIDNDNAMLDAIRKMLAIETVDVLVANDLDDGLAMVIKHIPKVIILGRIMTGQDERSALPALSNFAPFSSVIVLSGYPGVTYNSDSSQPQPPRK